jgi:hypothetical protein
VNKLIRFIGVAFVVISVFSASLLYVASINYLDVTETTLVMPENMDISEVQVPTVEDESQDVTVRVFFKISNPSKLAVVITSIESHFYMDNKSDPRSFAEKAEDVWVGVGQFTLQKEEAYLIRPGESVSIPVNMTVRGGTRYVSVLNTTFAGKYYPIIVGRVFYTFKDFNVDQAVKGVIFMGDWYDGIEPYD